MKSYYHFKINEEYEKELMLTNNELSSFMKDLNNIINMMFYKHKNIKYNYDNKKSNIPSSVEFEIVYNDWFTNYDEELKNEYSPNVLKKRKYEPVLVFNSKWKDENKNDSNKNKYYIKFDIKAEVIDNEKIRNVEIEKERDKLKTLDTESLIKILKSKRFSENTKNVVKEILKRRGIDYEYELDMIKKRKRYNILEDDEKFEEFILRKLKKE